MKETWTINVSEFGFLEKEGMLLTHIKIKKMKVNFHLRHDRQQLSSI